MLAFRFMEMKICKYFAGHMTKMAAMLVYGKIPKTSSSLEPEKRLQGNLFDHWHINSTFQVSYTIIFTIKVWSDRIYGKVHEPHVDLTTWLTASDMFWLSGVKVRKPEAPGGDPHDKRVVYLCVKTKSRLACFSVHSSQCLCCSLCIYFCNVA